jgi:lipoprotein-releasing system permease protein
MAFSGSMWRSVFRRRTMIELRVDDVRRDEVAKSTHEPRLRFTAHDWADLNKSLFSALWLEKMVISITIGLIVIVAALNIAASLVFSSWRRTATSPS